MSNFYTDFLVKSEYFQSTSRVNNLDYLEPITRAAVQAMLADAVAAGEPLLVIETYRSSQRQQYLYQQGLTQLQIVGCHGYGLAADFARENDLGQPTWTGDFGIVGKLAAKHGLVWGGSWKNFKDYGHVQRCSIADQEKLFASAWYPDSKYNPLTIEEA